MQTQLWTFLITPIVGGVIGWSTNVIAIKMIFHPRVPIRIPLTPWKIHGLLPKRRADLAKSVAKTVSEELVSIDSLLEQIDYQAFKTKIAQSVIQHVDQRLADSLPTFIPSNLRHLIRRYASDLIEKESDRLLEQTLDNIKTEIREEVDVETIVEEEILSLDMLQLENMVMSIAKTELTAIEILGAILGFAIGLFQAALITIMS